MIRRLIPIFLAAVVVAAILTAAFRHTTANGGPIVVAGKVPVVACKTTRGFPETGQARFGRKLKPTVQGLDVPTYAYYTDDARQITPLLGPRGWSCEAVVAADGGTGLTLIPPLAARRDEPSGTMGERIGADWEPACQGCVAGLICRFLPKAARTFDGGFYNYIKCSGKRPADERIRRVKGSPGFLIVRFRGRSDGVLLFRRTKHGAMAALATCDLPGTAHSACGPILRDFATRDQESY